MTDDNDANPFIYFLEAADQYGAHLGIDKKTIISIYEEPSDWAFFLKVDAILETASKELIGRLMVVKLGRDEFPTANFVDALNMDGRTGVFRLLELSRCPADDLKFIKAVRRVRNAYAHDIHSISKTAVDLIAPFKDSADIIRDLSYIAAESYDHKRMKAMLAKSPGTIRFSAMTNMMAVLYVMHKAFPHPDTKVTMRAMEPAELLMEVSKATQEGGG